jgi:hypothetical protein
MAAIVRRAVRAAVSLVAVAAVTWAAKRSPVPINATTAGFACLPPWIGYRFNGTLDAG